MRTSFCIARLAALAALMMAGDLAPSYAASCELSLRAHYKCSATFDVGGSADYCTRTDVIAPGDGQFVLIEAEASVFHCTCEAKGRAPNVQFGGSSRDFFCGDGTDTSLVGRVTGSRITGQGYNATLTSEIRSVFTCQAVETCP